jgi:hypothetical protein
VLLLSLALALAAPEENTFALVANVLEWGTPDLRLELGGGEAAGAVLSWPMVPISIGLATIGDCRAVVVAEPFIEPQLRPGAREARVLLGTQLAWSPGRRGAGLLVDGGALRVGGGWGWVAGGGLQWTGGANRGVRGRVALRGRYVAHPSGPRGDVSLDVGLPIAVRGWRAVATGQSIDAVQTCREPRPREPEPVWPASDPACVPSLACEPDACGPRDDGCGGLIDCGPCWEELPGCDPYPCMPGMCGESSDGCGGTQFCGMCEEELLPACDPDVAECLPGMCGEVEDGCGGILYCGPCDDEILTPACDPTPCPPGACGVMGDGCGGTQSCGPCPDEEPPVCEPMACLPGTCGAQPDGCGGMLDCGPCGP